MDPALAPGAPPASVVFQDGLGERRRVSDATGNDTLELLCLREELTAVPSFEFALRERTSRLANFRHTYFGRVRNVDRLNDPDGSLAIVCDSIRGVRLSNLLAATERRPIALDINASLHLIRQLVSAVALLHENARDVAHGALGPERIIVTPNARVVIVEYVLGAALEQLRYSHERYWRELRIALPPTAGLPRFDHRSDITQIGAVALSLIVGRLLQEDEYPARVGEVVASAWAISARGGLEPLPPGLRSWLTRALQLDPRHSFASALEARDELDRVLSGEDEEETVAGFENRFASSDASAPDLPLQSSTTASVQRTSASAAALSAPTAVPTSAGSSEISSPGVRLSTSARGSTVPSAGQGVATAGSAVTAGIAAAGSGWVASGSKTPGGASPTAIDPGATQSSKTVNSVSEFVSNLANPAASAPTTPAAASPAIVAPTKADPTKSTAKGRSQGWRRAPYGRMALGMVALVVLSLGGFAARRYVGTPAMPPVPGAGVGSVNISSNPPGAQVLVDGLTRGMTPLTLTLKAGGHLVELRGNGEPRTVPITVSAGTQTSQYIELPKDVVAFGQLQIRTEPAGAMVTVDGVPRGRSPVLVQSLAAGDHAVVLESDTATVKQTVSVEPGATAALVVPLTAAETAPLSGWVSVSAPVEVQLFENKRLLGTTQSDRVMVTAGRHDIEIVNEPLGYRAIRSLQVAPGKTVPIKLEWPKGQIALNALPWAEVFIDGESVGETPIGNLSLPIGPHEIVFKNPTLGEQRYAATVSLRAPARVSVDLRKR
jgi:serine/threonine protein kinase